MGLEACVVGGVGEIEPFAFAGGVLRSIGVGVGWEGGEGVGKGGEGRGGVEAVDGDGVGGGGPGAGEEGCQERLDVGAERVVFEILLLLL